MLNIGILCWILDNLLSTAIQRKKVQFFDVLFNHNTETRSLMLMQTTAGTKCISGSIFIKERWRRTKERTSLRGIAYIFSCHSIWALALEQSNILSNLQYFSALVVYVAEPVRGLQ